MKSPDDPKLYIPDSQAAPVVKRIFDMSAAGLGVVKIREFIQRAKEYVEMPKLTPELLRVFIRRIEVYEKPIKYSRTCGNPIAIYYTFRLPEQDDRTVDRTGGT